MKKKMLPFWLWPSNWGLDGARRARAKAEYELEGEELERALLEIDYLDKDSVDYKLAVMELNHAYGRMSKQDYDREQATLKGESYFVILSGSYQSEGDTGRMMFELDWNSVFVDELSKTGWPGRTADEIVNNWFEDTCRQVGNAVDEFGITEETALPMGSLIQRNPVMDGKVEYR